MSSDREPTVVFVFDNKNWIEKITPVSKLELLDIIPLVATQFYMELSINSYVLVVTKSKWDSLIPDIRQKFTWISRRIKEEMEGPMSSLKREIYEKSDLFDFLMGKQHSESLSPIIETSDEKDDEVSIDGKV